MTRSPKVKKLARAVALVKEQTRAAKARFDAAHEEGMKALERADYEKLGAAIAEERQAIEAMPKVKLKATKTKQRG